MIDWNVWKDKIHTLQVERRAWRCAGEHCEDGYTSKHKICYVCQGTGKQRDVAEIICHVHADLSEAWSLCIKGDLPYYSHRVGGHLAAAALRVLDLAGYKDIDISNDLVVDRATFSVAERFYYAHDNIPDYLWMFIHHAEAIAIQIDVNLEAAMTARFDDIAKGGEL